MWSALIDIAKGESTLPRIQNALISIKTIQESEGIADISGWFAGVFTIYLIPQWPYLHTGRENEVLQAAHARNRGSEVNEDDMQVDGQQTQAAHASNRGSEGNEDDMQVDGQQTQQNVDASTSSQQSVPNDSGLFFYLKMKGC